MSQFEQRANHRFMCRWGKSASETLSALQQVYGDTALKKSAVSDWFSRFKNGQETLEDDQRSGRPSTSRTEEMIEKVQQQLIQCDRRMAIVEWNKKLGSLTHPLLPFCPTIWSWDVSPSLFRGSWPRIRWSLEICLRKVRRTQRFSQRSSLVMSHGCSPTIRRRRCSQQSGTQSLLPDPKNSRFVKSKEKAMLIAFFDIDGVVHHDFVPPGQTVNCQFYVQVLQRLRHAVRRKRREKWQREWFLYHDNAPSHASLVVQEFLAEKSIPFITQPPYSPDLVPSDFWLFSILKMGFKGTGFATMEGIKSNATAELQKIPKEAFRRCFQQWQDRWSKCVCAQGSYFEGD